MIFITESFDKLLKKIKSVSLSDVITEIKKHKNWIDNFKKIWEEDESIIFKGYLLSKKVRFVVLFHKVEWDYIPFYVVKKETKKWYNISKITIEDFYEKLSKIQKELENSKYVEIEI
jgi:hypothetical protein